MISKRLRGASSIEVESIRDAAQELAEEKSVKTKVRRVKHVKVELNSAENDIATRRDLSPTAGIKPDQAIRTEKSGSDNCSSVVTVKHEIAESVKPLSVQPKNWLEIYNRVVEMRKHVVAPVDSMGCEKLPEEISATITPKVHRYQLLIALMLSSQTKDEVNAMAMTSLRLGLNAKGGLTVDAILDTDERDIDTMIFKVGFHTRKAGYIKRTSQILKEQYDSDIPKTIAEMVALPGVGPKMAHLLLHRAWGVAEGIGVDVHVHRLANMWGWVNNGKYAPTPERTRASLESWLPREYWVDINPLLVGFGQTICLPRGSKCEECTLAHGLCPGVDRKRLKRMAKATKEELE